MTRLTITKRKKDWVRLLIATPVSLDMNRLNQHPRICMCMGMCVYVYIFIFNYDFLEYNIPWGVKDSCKKTDFNMESWADDKSK